VVVTRVEDDNEVAKGLKRVVEDLASGDVRVKDIYARDDRIKYIDSLPPEDLPDTSNLVSEFRHLESPYTSQDQEQPSRIRKITPSSKKRSILIPRDLALFIDQPRINDIYRELKKLNIEEYSNAVSVLFRVFLELSADAYIKRERLGTDEGAALSKKLLDVADALKSQSKLDDQQLKPVRRAAQKDSFLASTVTTMNQYVHNPYSSPAPSDLRAAWDSLQVFIEAIWS
jgi:predicted transcriptional regulator